MGVGPVGFAILTITPSVAAMVMPLAWGAAWTMHARLVLRGSPLLQLCAQALLVCGVLLHTVTGAVPVLTACVLVCGLVFFSIGRAGLAIAQHATLARLYKSHLVLVFAAMTGCTQVIAALVNLIVPRIVEAVEGHDSAFSGAKPEPDSELRPSMGLLAVQVVLLIPHSLASIAGALLARSRPRIAASVSDVSLGELSQLSSQWFQDNRLTESSPSSHSRSCCGSMADSLVDVPVAHEAQLGSHGGPLPPPLLHRPLLSFAVGLSPAPSVRAARRPVQLWASAVVALAVWRGLAIGSLHALKPVLIAMLVSVGASTVDAGGVIAINYALALAAYVLLALMSSAGKLRWFLVALPAVGLLAFATMLLEVETHGAVDSEYISIPVAAQLLLQAAGGVADPGPASSPRQPAMHSDHVLSAIDPAFRAALLGVALVAAASPVVPLALVPANTGDHGLGYGVLESIFEGAEIIMSLLIGVCRAAGGFGAVLMLIIGTFAGAFLVGLRLVTKLREQVLDRSWWPSWFQQGGSQAHRATDSPVSPVSPSNSARELIPGSFLLAGLRGDVGEGGHTLRDHQTSRKGMDDYHRMVE